MSDERPNNPAEYLARLQLGDARAFLLASRKLDEWGPDFSPKYYLLIHATELAAKSFLLASGVGSDEVVKLRHDLVAIFGLCTKKGLVLEHPRSADIVALIAPVHLDHRLRYGRPGEISLPNTDDLQDFCDEVLSKAWTAYRSAFPSGD